MLDKTLNYAQVFLYTPVAQLVTRERVIVDCSLAFAHMFSLEREQCLQHSARMLYPTQTDFETTGERIKQILTTHGRFSDTRVMRRSNDTLFWVGVQGYTRHRNDPYREALWVFHEARTPMPVPTFAAPGDLARQGMTARERDVAVLLVQNLTAKEIGKTLGISHRTVEIYRNRLMKKFYVNNVRALIAHLLM